MAEDVVTLRAGGLEARFVASVGMVAASLFHRGRQLLGQRGGLEAYASRGSTFGIPLLHPWANRLGGFTYAAAGRTVALDASSPRVRTEEHGLPIHGLLAASRAWRVLEREPERVVAEHAFEDPELLAGFPFPHMLRFEATIDPGALTIATTVTPTTGQAVPVAFGFHPYLALQEDRDACTITLPARTRLELDARGLPTGARSAVADAGPLALAGRAYDDLFTDLTGEPFVLAGGGRAVAVRFGDGYTHAQVFAPAGRPFCCFEPMTAPTDALRTGDGLRLATAPFTASFSIEVR